MSTDCIPQKEQAPQSFSGGLAPAECKDDGVFIFISEEMFLKNLGVNVKQVFLLRALPRPVKLRWQNVKLEGRAGVASWEGPLPPGDPPFSFDFKEQKVKRGTSV